MLRNFFPSCARCITFALALSLAVAWLAPLQPGFAATSELLIADRHTGLALYGYDPVSYYIDRRAHAGSASFEMTLGGLTWRFRSEANRAAFRAQPGSYIPKFGGYDPMVVIRGAPVAGHPAVFLIYRDELFLFSSEGNRDEFLQRPDALLQAAKSAWPAVRRTLVP